MTKISLLRKFILLMISTPLFAQSHNDSVNYFKSYFTNTRDILVEPFHWNKNDLANLTMVAGGTAFLMIYDEKIDDFMLRNQNENLTDFCNTVLDPFGNGDILCRCLEQFILQV